MLLFLSRDFAAYQITACGLSIIVLFSMYNNQCTYLCIALFTAALSTLSALTDICCQR